MDSQIFIIINYLVRATILVLGILLVAGVFTPENTDGSMFQGMGAMFILFGIYRLAIYRTQLKKLKRESDED